MDRFIAIHHFDNSIELFLKIIATKEGVISSIKQDFKLKDLWSEVKTSLEKRTPPYNLPLKDQVFNLHDTRNLAQHQGDAPSYETVIKYREYLRDFFIQCFMDIFDIEYSRIYASVLVNDKQIRDSLIEAEQGIESENFKESMCAPAKAFAYLKLKEREDFSSNLSRLTTFGVVRERDEVRFSEIRLYGRLESGILEKINDYMKKIIVDINKLSNERAKKINNFAEAVEEEIAILKLGADYKSFRIFNKISPHTYFVMGSSEPGL